MGRVNPGSRGRPARCSAQARSRPARPGTDALSQAISEGDGISIVVPVGDPGTARAAEEQGAEALALHALVDIREATACRCSGGRTASPDQARAAAPMPA